MGDVIHLAERLRLLIGKDDDSSEKFLIEEGLEMLAAYREIQDIEVRRSVLRLLKAMVQSSNEPKPEPK